MRLTRLRLESFRQFRQGLEITGFEPGINLFTGPNESGKSTLVRALQAAFFERHRSGSVDDLRPWGDGSAAPELELDFEIGGSQYRLHKRFLQRKRCELTIDGRDLEGDEAEQALADLLGFQFPSRGASKPEHWGIPGLLWVEQGSGQAIHAAVDHATDHLRRALNTSLGEVASSTGERVIDAVRTQRAELLTATGKPRGDYAEMSSKRQALAEQIAELDGRIATYRHQVDQLGTLLAEQAADDATRPWDALRQQKAEAEAALEGIRDLMREQASEQQQLNALRGTIAGIHERLADHERQKADLAQRQDEVTAATTALELARSAETLAGQRRDESAQAYEAANRQAELARQESHRARLAQEIGEQRARHANLATALEKSRTLAAQRSDKQREAAALAMDEADLKTLRGLERERNEVRIRQENVATRLSFDLESGHVVNLDEQPLSGQGERRLTRPATLVIPGIGTVTIEPGGDDLAPLAQRQADLDGKRRGLLARLGVDDLDAAEQRWSRLQDLHRDLREIRHALDGLAPNGLDALQTEDDEVGYRLAAAQAALAQLPAPPDTAPPPLDEAERERRTADAQRQQAGEAFAKAQGEVIAARTRLDAATQELNRLSAQIADPARVAALAAAREDLAEHSARRDQLQAAVGTRQQQIDAARPDMLEQDVQRLGASVEQATAQYQQRRVTIGNLQGQLEQAGAQGLEEQRDERLAALQRLDRRHGELQRRADALELLLRLLEDKRLTLTRRLQAPLQVRLNHYLGILFPGASLELDEQLRPSALRRGDQAGAIEHLSFGAREQMGIIGRLAYADLLQAAGRPTLVVLDDALVHSDGDRLGHMKRILFDAAQRHQMLIFTCHPNAWRDLGVPQRSMASLGGAPAPGS